MSDFLLWQSSNCCLHFDKVLWPEFEFYHLCLAVLHYQRHFTAVQDLRRQISKASDEESSDEKRVTAFMEWFEQSKVSELERLAANLAVN